MSLQRYLLGLFGLRPGPGEPGPPSPYSWEKPRYRLAVGAEPHQGGYVFLCPKCGAQRAAVDAPCEVKRCGWKP